MRHIDQPSKLIDHRGLPAYTRINHGVLTTQWEEPVTVWQWEANGLSSRDDSQNKENEHPPVDTGMVAVYRLAGVI